MSRLRIVHIITRLDFGSAELSTLYAVQNLNRSLFETHLITGPGGALDEAAEKLPDVSLQYCGELSREVRPLADLDAFDSLRTMLKELKPDIVHTHRSKAGIVGRLAAGAAGVPFLIHTYHGFGFHKFQPEGAYRLTLALDREANRRSNHLVFVSDENWKEARQLDLLQQCSSSLIRAGVEVEPLLQAKPDEAFRKNLGMPDKGKIVGMIASLKPQKDPLTFVEAAALVARKSRSARFVLFGDGELADAVARRASKILRPTNFARAGWTDNVPEVLANLDALVVPSIWEGLPRIIPQATIAGVPVVASAVDGIREVVFEGRNGLLAEPQNAEDFAGKILKVLDDDFHVDEEFSRQIQHDYDIREMVRHLEALYLQVASEKDAPETDLLEQQYHSR